MGVLTEVEIRNKINKNKDMNVLYIKKGEIVTPSAKSFLIDKNIKLKYVEENEDTCEKKYEEKNMQNAKKYKYETIFGVDMYEKPEYMTQLRGNLLVFKDNKRIILRGKVDSLDSKLLELQIVCSRNNKEKLAKDLDEVISFVRNIMRCEVLDEQLGEFTLLGLTPKQLREQSHDPKKYFGIGHEYINYKMGEVVVYLNRIRSEIREVELCAYSAFKDQNGKLEREDLIKGLNRLSSLFWILIFKVRTGKY